METILVYATLSAIKEKKGNISSILEIFQDLVETSIKQHFNSVGTKGYIHELQKTLNANYHINMPLPTLELILKNINKSYSGMFHIYSDHSFDFSETPFTDVTQLINEQKEKIEKLERLFIATKTKLGLGGTFGLNELIEKNKKNLLAYFNNRPFDTIINDTDFDLLISFLQIPEHRNVIENLFLGAIISCFTLLDPERADDKKTMLLDTNFIISLMDLHSQESFETCDQIMKIGKQLKYDFCILPETITEIRNLLRRKSEEIKEVPLFVSQDRQSIEFGCYRKGMSGYELIEYEKFLNRFIYERRIRIIDMETNEQLKKETMKSEVYKNISNRPRNNLGALHDAMAMNYVKKHRTNEEGTFSDTTSFFITDSHGYFENKITSTTKLPLIIRAEELVTLLWLTFPYHNSNLVKSEISKIFSMHLNKKLPNRDIILSIDKKNRLYKTLGIHAEDCVKMAFDINEIEGSEIEELLSLKEEEAYFKEIGRLAYLASERRKSHDEKMKLYTEMAIDLTWQENNKSMLEENNQLKEETIKKSKENTRLLISNDIERLETNIVAQKEIIAQLEERINELISPLEKWNKILPIIFILVPILLVIYIGVYYIIPNWNKIQPQIFIFEVLLPLLLSVSQILSKVTKVNIFSLSHWLIILFFKKRNEKKSILKHELQQKKEYISSLIEKRRGIIY